jgi:peptidoglycan-N-acetylglucosamine deacetylase
LRDLQITDWRWPNDSAVAVSLTFDVDAETGFIGTDSTFSERLASLSEGQFGTTRGLPRILALLDAYEFRGTFFVPGYTAELHPDAVHRIAEAGHEIAHHGYMHLRPDLYPESTQRDEVERGLSALSALGVQELAGYRAPDAEMTTTTFRLLAEHGFQYDSSCMGDDRPYVETFGDQEILELPIHWRQIDIPFLGWGPVPAAAPADLASCWYSDFVHARSEGRHVTYTMHPEVIGRSSGITQLQQFLDRMVQGRGVWVAPLIDVARHVQSLPGSSAVTSARQ